MNDLKLKWKGDAVISEVNSALGERLEDLAIAIEDGYKMNVPVDTGALQGSITSTTDKEALNAQIGSTLDYSVYVEFGTRKMPAQPALRKTAMETNFNEFFDNLLK